MPCKWRNLFTTIRQKKKKPEQQVAHKAEKQEDATPNVEKTIEKTIAEIQTQKVENTAEKSEKNKDLSFTLEQIEAEVEQELQLKEKDKCTTTDELSSVSQGNLKLNGDNLLQVWENFLVHLSQENENTLLQAVDDKNPELKEKTITIWADSKVEKTLIEKDIFIVKKWFKQHFETNDYELIVKVPKNAVPKKILLNPKDIFINMVEKNKHVITLKNNLDLELDI